MNFLYDGDNDNLPANQETIPLEALNALKMVLLFHSCSPWDDAKRKDWNRLSDSIIPESTREATTKHLCDCVRKALGIAP